MSLQPPKIDRRTFEDIVSQTEKLAETFTAWCRPESNGQSDAGRALIRIFGNMAALVSDRLNQVPNKNFLTFLDLIGTQILPPQPAKVPLTFFLATGAMVDVLVPSGTQVAALPTQGEEEEVVFETDRDLVVTSAQLQAVFVRQPDSDRYTDCTQKATGIVDAAFSIFSGEQPIEHYLYLACDELLTLPGNKTLILTFDSSQPADLQKLLAKWFYWDGSAWQPLSVTQTMPRAGKLQVTVQNLPTPRQQIIDSLMARWLRVALDSSQLTNLQLPPSITQIAVNAAIEENFLAPDACFFNTAPLDLTKDFYPFGEQPRFNDTFYIACQQAFTHLNARVALQIELSDFQTVRANNVEILWEIWNGSNWQTIGRSSNSNPAIDSQLNFSDATQAFTLDRKQITFNLPSAIASGTVNGVIDYWIRARLVKGDYGQAAFTRPRRDANNQIMYDSSNHPIYEFVEASFAPPSVKSLSLSYTYNSGDRPLSACFAYNNFTYVDFFGEISYSTTIRVAAKARQKSLQVNSVAGLEVGDVLQIAPGGKNSGTYQVEAINLGDRTVILSQPLQQNYSKNTQVVGCFFPYVPITETQPTLYLGFDRPFPNRTIALYAQVEPPAPTEVAVRNDSSSSNTPPQLAWEYSSLAGWATLGVQDETSAFAERGLIRFIGPSDFTLRNEFEQTLYWLRVRLEGGNFRVQPRLRRLLTNTTWGIQAITLVNEVLGSSDGNPNQTFRTTRSPVLLGQQLQVQEGQMPSPAEHAALEQVEGTDAIAIERDEAGQIEAIWVRWHEVPDFYGSGSRDRHYVLDRLTGEIRFGDGQNGMVPPLGRNNIRLSVYRTGGGERGNRDANTITQLKTTIPYIDGAINLEAAGSGADLEPLDRVKERGPKVLRHRGRAVTSQDFEDLTFEASPDVARVKANVPTFNPLDAGLWIEPDNPNPDFSPHQGVQAGFVTLIIVPKNSSRQPTPSLALIEQVETYIRQRCLSAVDLWVAGPEWVEVSVVAEVVPVSPDIVDIVKVAVTNRLEEFLHPLSGGANGQGWDFGRQPHDSDIYAAIQSVDGVNYVRSLQVNVANNQTLQPNQLVFSGTHNITLTLAKDGR